MLLEISVPPTTKAICIMIPVWIEIWIGHHTVASSSYIGATLPTVAWAYYILLWFSREGSAEVISVTSGRFAHSQCQEMSRVQEGDLVSHLKHPMQPFHRLFRWRCMLSASLKAVHSCHPSIKPTKPKIREFIVWGVSLPYEYDILQATSWIALHSY